MQIKYLHEVPQGTTLQADVCIVGTGPAGMTLAHELSGSGSSVLVVESGGLRRDPWSDALNGVESIGAPRVADQWLVRNRVFGGASGTWSGRIATFDEIDFAVRDWVPWSGWPIERDELRPYFRRSLSYLGSTVEDNNSASVMDLVSGRWSGLDGAVFRPYAWSYSRDSTRAGHPVRFGPWAQGLKLPGVVCYLHASVTQIETVATGDRVRRLEVRTPDDTRRWVRARNVVLCTGAIENARLLLASNRTDAQGVGNRHDMVGRFLMDHLRGPVGTYRKVDQFRVQQVFRDVHTRKVGPAGALTTGVALTAQVQQSERLLNCALFIHRGEIDSDDPLRAALDLVRLRDPHRALAVIARHPRLLATNIVDRAILRRGTALRPRTEITLQCMLEQRPDPDSRITLSRRTDAHGVPLPVIDWRISDQEARTARYASTRFAEEMRRLGLPVPDLAPMITDPSAEFHLPDVAHPTGTTRMSADPRTGVVDPDCAVHGVQGLYVTGSSVFPTAGHANPTQMIVALAIRLADHLRSRLSTA